MERQPIFILPENVQRMMGRDAQRNNIMAARLVADTVKTTLGPKGMDKMLVSSIGDITVTNDGVTILEEMEIEHPAAKMMVEIAKTQEAAVGDGTTTAVVIAGKLLENAEFLLDKKIHPTVIAKGYRIAAEKAQEILEEIATKITPKEELLLKYIAMTAMTGKGAETAKDKFSDIVVKAVKMVYENNKVDMANIKLEKRKGKGVEDSELIEGIVLDKEKVHGDMPSFVKNAKIALIDSALEIKNLETDTKISVSSPEQLQEFLNQEEKILKNMVEKIKKAGANVVFCQKGIDDIAQYYLTKGGIYACRRIAKSDMDKLAKATGGKIISNLNELTGKELGKAAEVSEEKEGEEALTNIKGCPNPKALTILIRGGTEHVIDEMERAIKDALGDVAAALTVGKIVAGGGGIEAELAKRLRDFSQGLSGREQLAVEQFVAALESIPATLAENAGLDPIDVLTELKARHEKGEKNAGLNLFTNKIEDVMKVGIIEPLKIKTQAIDSASEVAMMILRIDDVIASSGGGAPRGMPHGGMGGMPEGGEY
ncbi:TCP-1/cpn60 chaperonin family protein [Candidatus Pacearchaeota archaeon]|nr:TCP-1/cpn60 chaperonin family protein [Candidatus Pacearchaeota archaeon]